MKISLATIKNAREILALQKLAYQSEAEICQDWCIPPLTQTIDEIEMEFTDHIFYKAVNAKKIIGSVRAIAHDNTCFIGRLIVHPELQGKGIGSKLMDTIEKHFSDLRRYELFTGNKSIGNIRFYKRLGYTPFKEEKVNDYLSFIYFNKENI